MQGALNAINSVILWIIPCGLQQTLSHFQKRSYRRTRNIRGWIYRGNYRSENTLILGESGDSLSES